MAYDFFHAEEAINKAEKNADIYEWTKTVVSNLQPAVLDYANDRVDRLMSLIISEKVKRDIDYKDILRVFTELYKAKGRVL